MKTILDILAFSIFVGLAFLVDFIVKHFNIDTDSWFNMVVVVAVVGGVIGAYVCIYIVLETTF